VKLPLGQRIVLVVLFSLGFVVVVAGTMRTYWVTLVVHTYDVTWNGYYMWIWTAVEVNLGVLCGCVPTLKPLFKSLDDMEDTKRRMSDMTLAELELGKRANGSDHRCSSGDERRVTVRMMAVPSRQGNGTVVTWKGDA
jgi:hypothetical protein